jgi:signal transduction histidine kinase
MHQKAGLPIHLVHSTDNLRIIDFPGTKLIPDGSTLLSIENIQPTSLEDIEFLMDGYSVEDSVQITFLHNSIKRTISVELIYYYNHYYLLSAFLTGIIFLFFGIFVLIKCKEKSIAVLFHFIAFSVAGIIMMTWGKYGDTFLGIGYFTRIIFHLCYLMAPAMFLHFALMYPTDRTAGFNSLIKSNYIISFLLAIVVNVFFINAALEQSNHAIDAYLKSFGFLRLYIIIGVFASVGVFLYSLLTAKSETEKKKLKWILAGFFIGPVSFVLLWVIPQLLNMKEVLPEEAIILLNISVPLTFAISILKYHLLDIDYIINKSIVYVIVLTSLTLFYILVILSLIHLLNLTQSTLVAGLSAIIIGLMFMPVKNKVQKIVDVKFFRVRYDFRIAFNKIINTSKEFNDLYRLSEFLAGEINSLIPVDKVGIFEIDTTGNSLNLIAGQNLSHLLKPKISINLEKLETINTEIIALPDTIEREAKFSSGFSGILKRYGLNVLIPIVSESSRYFGLIALGSKLSGLRYSVEDIDLLKSIASTAAATIDRIKLQEELIKERIAAEKLEELNKQKSLYVSAVTHDLKVPLTSIKLFTELIMGDKDIINEQVRNHLNIIENETDRLSRLVTNILDISKIERGAKKYHLKHVKLNKIVEELLDTYERLIRRESFNLTVELDESDSRIFADTDAVKQAIQNLIHNSIRYSGDRKEILIKTFCDNSFVCFLIEDKGKGVRSGEIDMLFDPYYRADSDDKGIGLGLYIVKHIMDSHNGIVDMRSELNVGTAVTLKFPKNNQQ